MVAWKGLQTKIRVEDGSLNDRKSTSGMVCKIGRCSVTWPSKRQDVVALSITEAEYIAATSAACQLV